MMNGKDRQREISEKREKTRKRAAAKTAKEREGVTNENKRGGKA